LLVGLRGFAVFLRGQVGIPLVVQHASRFLIVLSLLHLLKGLQLLAGGLQFFLP
jgi:hypothetical protein